MGYTTTFIRRPRVCICKLDYELDRELDRESTFIQLRKYSSNNQEQSLFDGLDIHVSNIACIFLQ